MSRINSDDPAFPHLRSECQRVNESEMYEGLTIRAYFAGQALAGLCSRKHYDGDAPTRVAQEAIEHADALIEEFNR
jgi:hypothetical protein